MGFTRFTSRFPENFVTVALYGESPFYRVISAVTFFQAPNLLFLVRHKHYMRLSMC